MRTPLVFSYTREQSLFMTAIISLLTFLSVLALGIALAIGTGVARWNSQWDLTATVQIMSEDNAAGALQIIADNRDKIASVAEVSKQDMEKMLRPWMSGGGGALAGYLPQMYELKFKNRAGIESVGAQLSAHARFLTHADALKSSAGAGWRMIWISALVLLLTLGAIGACITYIARNTALLHRRELEILNQIGARDSFVAGQMQKIVARICLVAGLIGSAAATPVLALILSAARSARIGLMAMIGLGGAGWTTLILMPLGIIIFSIWITKKTTHKILENS
jgi:cell division protein FtsX